VSSYRPLSVFVSSQEWREGPSFPCRRSYRYDSYCLLRVVGRRPFAKAIASHSRKKDRLLQSVLTCVGSQEHCDPSYSCNCLYLHPQGYHLDTPRPIHSRTRPQNAGGESAALFYTATIDLATYDITFLDVTFFTRKLCVVGSSIACWLVIRHHRGLILFCTCILLLLFPLLSSRLDDGKTASVRPDRSELSKQSRITRSDARAMVGTDECRVTLEYGIHTADCCFMVTPQTSPKCRL
jgi:hypothetical protein